MGEEVSPGGSDIFRHEALERDLEFAFGDEALLEALDGHLTRAFGDLDGVTVFHEVISDLIHVDVHVVPPSGERAWLTLVTSGMAQRPMTVPEGLEDYRYAELMLALPAGWPMEDDAMSSELHYWPLRLLKFLSRLPHEYETFLYHGHTIPNEDPPVPYADGTELCGAIIGPPVLGPAGIEQFEVGDGRVVHVYAVIPIHEDEMELKLEKGADALWELFDGAGVTELVDPERESVVPRKRRLFGRG
jgi:Suppressor of fused protein (SUFU)